MSQLINSIEFKDVCFRVEDQEVVFDNANIKFPLGEVISLRGERGAGRSTLLQILAGLQIPSHGVFEINGINMLDLSFEDFLPYRLKIGYAFDLGGLISNRTLVENLLLPLNYHRICTPEEARERVDYYINKFGLQKTKDLRPANVPGGLRKLTCLLRSLLLEPEVLLLDDPTVGLAKPVADMFCKVIEDLRRAGKNHTVIFSSYDDAFSRNFETASLYLEGGQIYNHQQEKKAANV